MLLLPGVVAQSHDPAVETRLEGWESPLDPGESDEFTLLIEYDCSRVDPANGTSASIEIVDPDWANVTGPRAVMLHPEGDACLENDTRETKAVPYNVSLKWSAPALNDWTVPFNVTVMFADGEKSDVTVATLTATFVAKMDVQVNRRVAEIRPGETATYNLTVVNDSNDWVVIEARVADADDRLNVSTPATEQVASARFRTDYPVAWRGGVKLRATPPSDAVNPTYDATIEVTASYRAEPGRPDPSVGSTSAHIPLTVTVLRNPRSEEQERTVSGFVLAPALATLALTARTYINRQR